VVPFFLDLLNLELLLAHSPKSNGPPATTVWWRLGEALEESLRVF
jgi:hypothetical protein